MNSLTLRAIRSGPMSFTNAGSRFQIVGTVLRATRQTLINLLVNGATVFTLPASFAVTLSTHARSMARAWRVNTIGYKEAVTINQIIILWCVPTCVETHDLPWSQNGPFQPRSQWHSPSMHRPWPVQPGTWHSPAGTSHSGPFQPSSQWQMPPP